MQIKRRSISLLLILAMMTIALVSLLPLTAAADPVGDNAADIQDFSYQTLSNANQTDATTDLRVMFTIGSLDYDEVGFVFSTSNSAPTAGGAGTYSTTTVHSAINAGGGAIPAGEGRFWVAVKLSDIPLASFETPIYVRPFIQVGENYSYIDAKALTVCQALTYDKTVAGERAIYNSKSPTGHAYESGDDFQISQTIADIRGKDTPNEKHFFPTTADATYKQLYIEYSFLWNETLANAANARMSLGSLGTRDLFGFYLGADGAEGRDAGDFDLCLYLSGVWGQNNTSSIYAGWKASDDIASYPTLGGNYGWHRIGIVFDYDVLRTKYKDTDGRADADAHDVEYYGEIFLYVDGNLVWEYRANIQGNWGYDADKAKNTWLNNNRSFRYNSRSIPFVAYAGAELQTSDVPTTDWIYEEFCVDNTSTLYTDPKLGKILFYERDTLPVNVTISNVADSTEAVYIAVSDVHFTCGNGFVRQVRPVAEPTERTVNLGGNEYSAKIWYVFDN